MGFWSLFPVASTPIVQVLLIGLLGAYLASGYSNLLPHSARRDMNKVTCSCCNQIPLLCISLSHIHSDLNHELTIQQVVFTVFTPSLMFASLAKTVTLKEIISW